jgi:pimeloyl-ACP methyl ester carboxylesterase
MERVTHHGRSTAYRHTGSDGDRTVLCVHGSGGHHGVWRAQSRLPAAVVSVDLSGHGESDDVDADPGFETLSAYVDDVEAVARETGARTFAGSSLGGAVLLTLALERDYRVDGLVLAGTGARMAVFDDLRRWLEDDFDRAIEFLHEPDRLFHDADERALSVSRDAMRGTGRAVTRRDFESCHTFDVRDDVDRIDVPALAIVGQYDRLTPPAHHEFLADRMSDCELAVIEDAAHLAMLEQPAAFNAAVETFLDRL